MTPEKLLEAFDRFDIQNNINADAVGATIKWFVIDAKSAEPEVNWPGDLISEHDNLEAARLSWASEIIKTAEDTK